MRKAVVSYAGLGIKTLIWIKQAERKDVTMDELAIKSDEYEDVELALAEAMHKILQGDIKRDMTILEDNMVKQDTMLSGRQSLLLLYRALATDVEMIQSTDVEDFQQNICKGESDLSRWWCRQKEVLQQLYDPDEATEALACNLCCLCRPPALRPLARPRRQGCDDQEVAAR